MASLSSPETLEIIRGSDYGEMNGLAAILYDDEPEARNQLSGFGDYDLEYTLKAVRRYEDLIERIIREKAVAASPDARPEEDTK